MTRTIRFDTAGANLLTAMSIKESVRKQLREVGIAYEEQSQLPYDVTMSERDFLVFCLVWDSAIHPWREVDSKKGLQ